MTIKFLCPAGHRLKADPDNFGRSVVCPTCGHEVIVPSEEDLDESALQDEDSGTFTAISVIPLPIPVPVPVPGTSDDPSTADSGSHSRPRFVHIHRPDEKRGAITGLAVALGLIIAFGAAPAAVRFDLFTVAVWPRVVLVAAVLQACYLAWMLAVPDWSTIRVVMFVFIVTAAAYAGAIVWIARTAPDVPLGFGLEDVRSRVLQWCGCMLTLLLFGAYLSARAARDWRRALGRDMAKQSELQPPSLSLDDR